MARFLYGIIGSIAASIAAVSWWSATTEARLQSIETRQSTMNTEFREIDQRFDEVLDRLARQETRDEISGEALRERLAGIERKLDAR